MPKKREIMGKIKKGLNNIEVARHEGCDWGREVKTELCKIGKGLDYSVYASRVDEIHRDGGEWLYDVTWLEYKLDCDDESLVDVHLVAECEWKGLGEIYHDFEKLLLARSGVRLMIFTSWRKHGGPRGIAERLARKVRQFKRSRSEDAWLLVAWERREAPTNPYDWWRFKYFTIDENGVLQDW